MFKVLRPFLTSFYEWKKLIKTNRSCAEYFCDYLNGWVIEFSLSQTDKDVCKRLLKEIKKI